MQKLFAADMTITGNYQRSDLYCPYDTFIGSGFVFLFLAIVLVFGVLKTVALVFRFKTKTMRLFVYSCLIVVVVSVIKNVFFGIAGHWPFYMSLFPVWLTPIDCM
jgi:FtsH-binding integral membrane protein